MIGSEEVARDLERQRGGRGREPDEQHDVRPDGVAERRGSGAEPRSRRVALATSGHVSLHPLLYQPGVHHRVDSAQTQEENGVQPGVSLESVRLRLALALQKFTFLG